MCCTMHADRPKNQLHETDLWTKNDFKLMKKFQFFIKRFGDRLSDHYHRFPMYNWTKFDILARQEPTKAKSTWFLTKSHLIRNLNDVNCGARPMVYQHINETVCIYIWEEPLSYSWTLCENYIEIEWNELMNNYVNIF